MPKQAPVAPPATPHHKDPSLNGTETILVVEDEADVSFFLETILQSHGYHVLCAADADQATTLFKQHPGEIQLVFSDIGLPKVDGITLCEKLRTMKPQLPLVLASGYPTKEYRERINHLGPQGFLPKPYNTTDILQAVRKALNGAKVLHLAS